MKINEIVNEGKQLNEGIIDYLKRLLFKKKQNDPTYVPVTPEQRDLIKSVFADSNAHIKLTPNGDYVLPYNVHARSGTAAIAFYSLDGQLMASVAHYRNARFKHTDRPVIHSDHAINSVADLEKLKDEISEGN